MRITQSRLPRPALVAALLVALLATSACYQVQPREEAGERPDRTTVSRAGHELEQGGDLAMGLSAEPDQLDPTTSSSLYTRYVMSSICEKLYDIDAEGELVPQLASALPSCPTAGRTVHHPAARRASSSPTARRSTPPPCDHAERHLTKDDSSRAPEMGPIDATSTAPTTGPSCCATRRRSHRSRPPWPTAPG